MIEGVDIPTFDFEIDYGYRWLIARRIASFESFSPLQPWMFLNSERVFDVSERWPHGPSSDRLVAFAARQIVTISHVLSSLPTMSPRKLLWCTGG